MGAVEVTDARRPSAVARYDRVTMNVQAQEPTPRVLHHLHRADLHACSSTWDELRPPAQPPSQHEPALPMLTSPVLNSGGGPVTLAFRCSVRVPNEASIVI
jgi:hypothetical protein